VGINSNGEKRSETNKMKAEEIKNKREVKKEKNNMKTKNKDKCRE
jgi:hypothetical protein